jgi:hypothetical protein
LFADALGAVEGLAFVAALRDSYLVYPLVNALHIIGIALLFGAIVPLDLRLAGWRRESGTVEALARLLIPVALFGFVVAAAAGLLLFATDARAYAASPLFRVKMLLIAAALANALLLRRVDWRRTGSKRLALAGAASAMLWLAVIVLGRLVGYMD